MKPVGLLLFFFLLGCARPDYVDNLEDQISGVTGECGFLFQSENICLNTEWVHRPTESEYGEMILTFTDVSDPTRLMDPVNGPHIVLWMPSMGHGSSPVSLERIEVGKFRAFDIFFIMPGLWDIRYQLKSSKNVVEEKIQKITI